MSSMKINYNVSAMVANNSLKINDNKLTASLERLSSGYKINSAKDDAAADVELSTAAAPSAPQAAFGATDGMEAGSSPESK